MGRRAIFVKTDSKSLPSWGTGLQKVQLKALARIIGLLAAFPVACCYRIVAAALSPEHTFPGFSQFMSLFPGTTGVYFRRAFYALVLPRCDEDACISFGTVFSHATACVGRKVYVGVGCMLGDVTLEDDVLLGSHVSVINGSRQHGIDRLDVPVREQPGEYPRVTIGQDSWIGDRAIVMADVGRHCVVGAGSVVTKPVPDYAIVVGNPARIARWRKSDENGNPVDDRATCAESLPVESSRNE